MAFTYTVQVEDSSGNLLSGARVSYKLSTTGAEIFFGTTGSTGRVTRSNIESEPIYISAGCDGYESSSWSAVYSVGTYRVTLYRLSAYIVSKGTATNCGITFSTSASGPWYTDITVGEMGSCYAKVTPNTGCIVQFCWETPINSCTVTLYSSSSGYNIYQISSATANTTIYASAMAQVQGVYVKSDGAWVQAQYYEKINGKWIPSTNWSSIYSKLNSGKIIKCPKPSDYPHEYYTINEDNCTNCNACSSVCGLGAIYQGPGKYRIDPYLCNCCGDCYDVSCPGSAIGYVEETDD